MWDTAEGGFYSAKREKAPGAGADLVAHHAQTQAGAGIHLQVETLEIACLTAVGVAAVLHPVQGA